MPNDTPTSPLITSLPLTAEAREDLLEQLFASELPHHGEIFVPGSSFYVHGTTHAQAKHMLKALCTWLGIKPGYIGIEFESMPSTAAQGQRHTIFLESNVVKDELLLGAVLAHALVRYLLEERKQVHLFDPNEQLSLVATGTVVFGLGIVILNALRPSRKYTKYRHELLGTLPLHEYGAMVHGFLWQRAVPQHAFMQNLTPWSAQILQVPKSKKPIPIIRQQYHFQQQKRYEIIGLVWLLFLVICIGGFVIFQRVKPDSQEIKDLKERVALLQGLKQKCSDTLNYTKLYADMTDILTVRSVNTEELRCKSLSNELLSAEQALNQAD